MKFHPVHRAWYIVYNTVEYNINVQIQCSITFRNNSLQVQNHTVSNSTISFSVQTSNTSTLQYHKYNTLQYNTV